MGGAWPSRIFKNVVPHLPRAAMSLEIDRTSYNKAAKYSVGHGYVLRPGLPISGVQHTTNNARQNTSFEGEAQFLFDSPDVSSHYLISKTGRIVQFLDPRTHEAWHAGGKQLDGTWTALPTYANPSSIGVEWHVSVGERPTQAQLNAGRDLWLYLMGLFSIPSERIETHRAIALPKGRKSDPEGFDNAAFYQWRATFITTQPDPWRGWGTQYPLDPVQRDWAIPQCWLRNTWLGEARSPELYEPDGLRSLQYFQAGWAVYQKATNSAQAYQGQKVP